MGEAGAMSADRAARERVLLKRYHEHGDTVARDRLAEEMLPLARALAGRYAGRGEPLDDLVQVACIGIMKAIDGFDLSREVRFSSYATPTVLGDAFDILSERDREILRLRFEEDMTQTEISERIGVSQMQVSRLIRQALARLRMDIESSARQHRINAA